MERINYWWNYFWRKPDRQYGDIIFFLTEDLSDEKSIDYYKQLFLPRINLYMNLQKRKYNYSDLQWIISIKRPGYGRSSIGWKITGDNT